jgi:hypothetical protein
MTYPDAYELGTKSALGAVTKYRWPPRSQNAASCAPDGRVLATSRHAYDAENFPFSLTIFRSLNPVTKPSWNSPTIRACRPSARPGQR